MPAMIRCRITLPAAVAAALAWTSAADGHTARGGGAAAAPERPRVDALKCDTGDRRSCPRGELLAVRGEGLDTVETVVFLGRRGRRDDRPAQPRRRSPHRVLLQVPDHADTGPVRAVSHVAGASRRSRKLRVFDAGRPSPPLSPPTTDGDRTFPVRGPYDFGTETNRFGGGRGHQGQDIFAACGTEIVAARAGELTRAGYEGAAGNFVVIGADDGTSQVYMHMQRAPAVRDGQRVAVGAPVGAVGQSGSAQGCHLHFELWTAPGWYDGGRPVDPLPELQRWAGGG